ncbi:putative methyltransferase YqeM [Hydractinia symbiolongicarpus]|uniref:putative methyltransferase YqeM n=1 Tax=Hydractinia symbiolongicarpus TaxID=13093 RepID=UPI002551294E|nr:putative methyltransferase YqeM [Hydractinia symbiolongicarpus]
MAENKKSLKIAENKKGQILSDEDIKLALYYYEKLYSNVENLSGTYDDLSSIYDEAVSIFKYDAYKRLAKDLAVFLEHKHLEEKLILDVGCGNGNLGKSLVEEGFKNIDGLDISEKLLEMCKETKCYNKLYKEPLTANPTPDIEDNSYDIAVSSGCYVAGHIPLDTLFELTRIVKPGGYIFYTLHDPNYTMDYMNWHGKLMKEKKAELISMKLAPYRLEPRKNFEQVYAYYVLFRVL